MNLDLWIFKLFHRNQKQIIFGLSKNIKILKFYKFNIKFNKLNLNLNKMKSNNNKNR